MAPSKPEYRVGQVVYRTHFDTYEQITGVEGDYVMFGGIGTRQDVLKLDVRPLTPQERGEVRDGKR